MLVYETTYIHTMKKMRHPSCAASAQVTPCVEHPAEVMLVLEIVDVSPKQTIDEMYSIFIFTPVC